MKICKIKINFIDNQIHYNKIFNLSKIFYACIILNREDFLRSS